MLSKAQEKYIRGLKTKKKRYELKQFIVEGEKLIEEAAIEGAEFMSVFVAQKKMDQFKSLTDALDNVVHISDHEMSKISQMDTPPGILAVVNMKDISSNRQQFILAIESISDPGNLGTIIRTAECFGIDQIWCSQDTVDQYNFKAVQASMGSIFRMPMLYCNLSEQLKESDLNVYASHLKGENLYQVECHEPCVLVIGSESHGVSKTISDAANKLIKIPQKGKVESLNAAMACGILLAELNRRFES